MDRGAWWVHEVAESDTPERLSKGTIFKEEKGNLNSSNVRVTFYFNMKIHVHAVFKKPNSTKVKNIF